MKSQFFFSLYALTSGAISHWNPRNNSAYGSRDIAILESCSKQKNTKRIKSYYWLYLKINNSEFRHILLDHITYYLHPGLYWILDKACQVVLWVATMYYHVIGHAWLNMITNCFCIIKFHKLMNQYQACLYSVECISYVEFKCGHEIQQFYYKTCWSVFWKELDQV